jgi:hypothetical protein
MKGSFMMLKDYLLADKLSPIFTEILKERINQNKQWGEQNHPMLYEEHLKTTRESMMDAQRVCALNASIKKLSWYDVLMEEVLEAFAETEPEKQRQEMIQVAAVAVAIIESLDRKIKGEI